jgi:hypothetical protein
MLSKSQHAPALRRRNGRLHHRTREAVIAAAHAVFVEQGYASATIEQIAHRAGVSRPTVFGVGTKAQLLALARRTDAELGELLRVASTNCSTAHAP